MMMVQSKDGTRIAYDVYGSGPSLIYCTGAACFRSMIPIVYDAKTFANSFTVYNYDRRGRGDSGNYPPYAIERELEDIETLINVAGGKASLYGHSSGAVLALEAALRFGHKIDKLVLYEPAYVCDEAEQLHYTQLRHELEALLQEGKHAKALSSFLKGIGTPALLLYMMRLMPSWKTMTDLAPTLLYDIELTSVLPPLARASQLDLPVLVAVGEKSSTGIQTVGRQLGEAIPDASFLRLEGQDHMVPAKVMLRVLSDFIQPMSSVLY